MVEARHRHRFAEHGRTVGRQRVEAGPAAAEPEVFGSAVAALEQRRQRDHRGVVDRRHERVGIGRRVMCRVLGVEARHDETAAVTAQVKAVAVLADGVDYERQLARADATVLEHDDLAPVSRDR